jgi:hypothetical protein
MNKFENVGEDDDTTILMRQTETFFGYDVMMECWLWDGFQGQSVIFCTKDVENLTDEELTNMIKTHYKTDEITLSRVNPEYVFLNFNFIATK